MSRTNKKHAFNVQLKLKLWNMKFLKGCEYDDMRNAKEEKKYRKKRERMKLKQEAKHE